MKKFAASIKKPSAIKKSWKEETMEENLLDIKRAIHSLFAAVNAILQSSKHGIGSAAKKAAPYRAIGDTQQTRDVYGVSGKVDIYSSKEMVKFYRSMSMGKEKPL